MRNGESVGPISERELDRSGAISIAYTLIPVECPQYARMKAEVDALLKVNQEMADELIRLNHALDKLTTKKR